MRQLLGKIPYQQHARRHKVGGSDPLEFPAAVVPAEIIYNAPDVAALFTGHSDSVFPDVWAAMGNNPGTWTLNYRPHQITLGHANLLGPGYAPIWVSVTGPPGVIVCLDYQAKSDNGIGQFWVADMSYSASAVALSETYDFYFAVTNPPEDADAGGDGDRDIGEGDARTAFGIAGGYAYNMHLTATAGNAVAHVTTATHTGGASGPPGAWDAYTLDGGPGIYALIIGCNTKGGSSSDYNIPIRRIKLNYTGIDGDIG